MDCLIAIGAIIANSHVAGLPGHMQNRQVGY